MQSKCLELKKREKKSRGNKDAEQLLKVRREINSWGGTRMQSSCLELEGETKS